MRPQDNSQKLVFGIHGVRHALRNSSAGAGTAACLYISHGKSNSRLAQLRQLAAGAGIKVTDTERGRLDSICGGEVHQGVALLLPQDATGNNSPALEEIIAASSQPLLLLLDQVQDPRNLGACIRSAEAAGADAVVVAKRNSAPLSAVARKAASGAAEHLPLLRVANLRQAMDSIRQEGVWIVGMDSAAKQDIYDIDLTVPLAIAAGAEEGGLRRLVRQQCDYLAKIPMPGNTESLNVSVAAAVALFEAARQRQQAG